MSEFLDLLSKVVCVACLIAMSVVVNLGVFFRFVLGSPIAWTEELSIFLMVWVAMLGASIALKNDEHVSFKFIRELFSWRTGVAMDIAARLVVFLFLAFLLKEGTSLALFVAKRQMAPTLGISVGWAYLALPVGSAIMVVHTMSWARSLGGDRTFPLE